MGDKRLSVLHGTLCENVRRGDDLMWWTASAPGIAMCQSVAVGSQWRGDLAREDGMSVEKGSSEGKRGERARRAQSTQRHFDGILHGRKPSRSFAGRLRTGLSQILALNGMLTMGREIAAPKVVERAYDSECYCRKAEAARHFEAWPIVQAVAWYLGYPLSYRDLEEMFQERWLRGRS